MFRTSIIAAMAGVGLLSLGAAAQAQPRGAQPTIVASANVAIAQTASGKVQGFVRNTINTFRGIPYAKAARFMPPTAPDKWNGTRTALSYGVICPQPINPPNDATVFISDGQYWPQAENCQNLNIWTPALADGKKRPVMVWLHGGGFFSGSSHENSVYHGEELAKKGDVVVVSVNHRLNILGFLDLSAYGDQYKASGNVGMADLVASLQWVRENIAAFGGDPDNVTIFGQSGGGGKVSTLLAAPSAAGLFEKAIIQSGMSDLGGTRDNPQAASRRVAELTIKHAGLQPGDIAGLQALSYEQLAAAGAKALADVGKEMAGGATGGPMGFPRVNWGPVVDGAFLTEKPFGAAAPALSAQVPLLIGTTLNEFQLLPNPRLANRKAWGLPEVTDYLRASYGERTDAIIAAYRAAYPRMQPNEWLTVDPTFRAGALRGARMKAEQPAPVYAYLFAWQSPILDGYWASGHSMEIAFTFNNVALGEQSTGGGAEVTKLSDAVSQAWINFARNGDPNHPGLPKWAPFTAGGGATMIFDNKSEVRVDHDKALMELLNARARP